MIELMIRKFCSRLNPCYTNKYFRAWIIMLLDTFMSMLASASTLLLLQLVLPGMQFTPMFIASWVVGALLSSVVAALLTKSYRCIIRYSTLRELSSLATAVFVKDLFLFLIMASVVSDGTSMKVVSVMAVADFPITLTLLTLMRVCMVLCYDTLVRMITESSEQCKVLVYGSDDKSVSMVARLQKSPHYVVCGFISPKPEMNGHKIMGLPVFVFSDEASVKSIMEKAGTNAILFAHSAQARSERERLMAYCDNLDCEMYITPSIDKVTDGKILDKAIRKIKIEDLLGRAEIKISLDEIESNFKDKTILVTGAAGSIGSELCRQLATFGIKELVMLDNAETPLHDVRLEFEEKFPNLKFYPVIGDVRHLERLDFVFRKYKPQIVFHAAAYKHVPLMEENPCEAVLVNVTGSRQVADKCLEYDVEKMVMISTDKAVNPTNIMGCTKRLAEIYVQSLGLAVEHGKKAGRTLFITTRFGNVLGSNGSVIPHFNAQIAAGGPITVTHPDIVRYFMSIPEACRLVMEAATISTGNQICVFDMGEPIKIANLAKQMVKLAGLKLGEDIDIKYTGLRPGEKLYEEVLATKENTVPTNHDSIFIAKVREYDYDDALSTAERLDDLARKVNVDDMVRLMKETVPEYKSKNSVYEKFDK